MSQKTNHKEIPKLSKEVIDLIKNFPNYYIYGKILVFGEPIWIWPSSINPDLTESQKALIEEKITNDELRKRYKLYGLCPECQQPNTWASEYKQDLWCQSCNAKHFKEEFNKNRWTSGNQKIDEFIKDSQQGATNRLQAIEWIHPDKLKIDKEFLEKGGFGDVYRVEWSDGYITNWNIKSKEWERTQETHLLDGNFFAIKVFKKNSRGSQQLIQDMLHEIRHYLSFATYRIVQCFGITQDPKSGDYAIMLTHTGETLSSYIKSNKSLNFKTKVGLLNCIASGLKSIHEKELVHRDFHDGNILVANHQNGIYSYIIDLGLCRKEDEKDRDYGSPKYLPPEYFEKSQYKRPADVYAFGIVAHLLFTGKFPFKDCNWGWKKIRGKVIRDKWLNFQENTNLPPLLMKLIKDCCDRNPSKRPPAEFLEVITERWSKDIGFYGEEFVNKTSEFYQQYEEMEKKGNKNGN